MAAEMHIAATFVECFGGRDTKTRQTSKGHAKFNTVCEALWNCQACDTGRNALHESRVGTSTPIDALIVPLLVKRMPVMVRTVNRFGVLHQ